MKRLLGVISKDGIAVYEIHSAGSSAKKSSGKTAPSVTSLIRSSWGRRGKRPLTYRDTAACVAPIAAPNSACDMPRLDKKSESFMGHPYHVGMEMQGPHTNVVLDGGNFVKYHSGMTLLAKLMIERKIGPTALAREIGTQQSQVSRWRAGERPIRAQWAIRLGDFFGVPAIRFAPEFRPEGSLASLDELVDDAPPHVREKIHYAVAETILKCIAEFSQSPSLPEPSQDAPPPAQPAPPRKARPRSPMRKKGPRAKISREQGLGA